MLPFATGGQQRLTLGENLQYAAKVEKKRTRVPVLIPDGGDLCSGQFKPASLLCKGDITLVESVQVPEVGEIAVPPKAHVEQPKDFVRRHPFFGLESPPCTTPAAKLKGEKKAKKKKKKSKKE